MSGWLASVTNGEEALQALAAGAHIIDAKNPQAGALGALDTNTIKAIVAAVAGRVPVSATIGDFPDMDPDAVAQAVAATGRCGVDFVKIGCFPGANLRPCLQALGPWAQRYRLVAVLFADQTVELDLVPMLAEVGFTGCMLDTADKAQGGLLTHMAMPELAAFVARVRGADMLCGLAGSLRVEQIAGLRTLAADYLGFRGALCSDLSRTRGFDGDALARVAQQMRLPWEAHSRSAPTSTASTQDRASLPV